MYVYIYILHGNFSGGDIYSPGKLLATMDGASLMHGSLSIYVCMDPFLGSNLQVGMHLAIAIACRHGQQKGKLLLQARLTESFRGNMSAVDPADA